MQMVNEKLAKLRTVAAGYLSTLEDGEGKSMLAYTLNLGPTWKQIIESLPLGPSTRVLDVGCGYGLLAIEIAIRTGASILASDVNPEFVAGAKTIIERSMEQGILSNDISIEFQVDDIMQLDVPEGEFDVVVVREVFSYVSDPDKAVGNLLGALKPGGVLLVEDIDDHLYMTYPSPSDAFSRLFEAIQKLQGQRGGDREVGRKLSVYLSRGGFVIDSVKLMTEALHVHSDPQKGEKRFIVDQIATLKDQLVDSGLLESASFDELLASVAQEAPQEEFRMNGRVVVQAHRP
ncbi:methyltransferase domain-containing protein [Acidithrix sp. C25]|uniref:class I SAM-dependent methyltransferase n=1 Tax=Acidithrix sp. C25 TaxID=1671482 RepID=UPI00191BAC62|nr:methyltransferase domain-containing protein [Acidithrix sp. C25]CAG4927641.1 unnamed protein product [Acidithrix sp. C25]